MRMCGACGPGPESLVAGVPVTASGESVQRLVGDSGCGGAGLAGGGHLCSLHTVCEGAGSQRVDRGHIPSALTHGLHALDSPFLS